jgi:hypothetical protein
VAQLGGHCGIVPGRTSGEEPWVTHDPCLQTADVSVQRDVPVAGAYGPYTLKRNSTTSPSAIT